MPVHLLKLKVMNKASLKLGHVAFFHWILLGTDVSSDVTLKYDDAEWRAWIAAYHAKGSYEDRKLLDKSEAAWEARAAMWDVLVESATALAIPANQETANAKKALATTKNKMRGDYKGDIKNGKKHG